MALLVMTLIRSELCVKLFDNAIENGMIFLFCFQLGIFLFVVVVVFATVLSQLLPSHYTSIM